MIRKIALVVVLACAVSASAAVTGFDLAGPVGPVNALGQLEVAPGSITVFNVFAIGTGPDGGGFSGIFTTSAPFQIVAAQASDIGGLYVSPTNNLDPFVIINPDGLAAGALVFGNGTLNVPDGALLARVSITAPLTQGTVGSVATFDSSGEFGNTMLGDGVGTLTQDSITLVTTPEPVSALLLLAGLPLIRRRRA